MRCVSGWRESFGGSRPVCDLLNSFRMVTQMETKTELITLRDALKVKWPRVYLRVVATWETAIKRCMQARGCGLERALEHIIATENMSRDEHQWLRAAAAELIEKYPKHFSVR